MFFAVEHPMARSQVDQSSDATDAGCRLRCGYPYAIPLDACRPVELSTVWGVAPEGQLRRAFLYYLERERAQPYRPFLQYNNGSEIGCEYWARRLANQPAEAEAFRRGQEQIWLKYITNFGEELVSRRGTEVDAFVHDFEWDDENLLWQFHAGYPAGFSPAQEAAARFGAHLGVWLSPWGGYPCQPGRVAAGEKLGYQVDRLGLTLADPGYYLRFRNACLGMVRQHEMSYFKFDGFGAGNSQPGPGARSSDVAGLLHLIEEIRAIRPDVFVNPSTGSWPSPFWLRWADSIWRQGNDTGLAGRGSQRQQWITYRDSQTYQWIVRRAPLYPLNSLMIHGVFVNRLPLSGNPYDPATPRPGYDPADIVHEIRSFFGSGTNLQEMYVAPELMTPATWDALAEAARWSRDAAKFWPTPTGSAAIRPKVRSTAGPPGRRAKRSSRSATRTISRPSLPWTLPKPSSYPPVLLGTIA